MGSFAEAATTPFATAIIGDSDLGRYYPCAGTEDRQDALRTLKF
jgi:hypothetical protein